MARVYLSRLAGWPHVYNVDERVGPGCPNRRDDVLLVQYFLRTFYQAVSEFPTEYADLVRQGFAPPDADFFSFHVDGVAGPQTFRWIRAYQDQSDKKGVSLYHDGIVSPARSMLFVPSGPGGLGSHRYTIIELNAHFRRTNPRAYDNIGFDADCPERLKWALSLA